MVIRLNGKSVINILCLFTKELLNYMSKILLFQYNKISHLYFIQLIYQLNTTKMHYFNFLEITDNYLK